MEIGGQSCVYSEISFPPLILVMAVESPNPDPKLMKINWFNEYGWRERWQGMLPLDCLEVNSPYPGNFATAQDIQANRAHRLSNPIR